MAEKQREHIRFTGYVQGVGFATVCRIWPSTMV